MRRISHVVAKIKLIDGTRHVTIRDSEIETAKSFVHFLTEQPLDWGTYLLSIKGGCVITDYLPGFFYV